MLRAAFLVASFCLSSSAKADDELPPDLSPKKREEWVTQWQPAYAKERGRLVNVVDDAKTKSKIAATAKEGREELARAQKALDELKKEPWRFGRTPFKVVTDTAPIGTVGWVAPGSYIASSTLPNGVMVEGTFIRNPQNGGKQNGAARYLVASPLKVAKDKKNPPVALPGLWYVAGTTKVDGKEIKVLYRFEIDKDDFPK
ncbi:hypothetical protein VT84_37750 [Gemmata sp. SH-PL17]|uniref:hypothetical protein n=1 Tax=Gemmata sp. SH-PL17 TaxID=1630693 RepID=UPI00078BD6E1|nr:hypothetical protein [Gemmata sp. SH-PL17]AMV30198.1 hypothetical protein VT84_37750 [Gemmata sp. SH-PL17]